MNNEILLTEVSQFINILLIAKSATSFLYSEIRIDGGVQSELTCEYR